MDLLGHVAAIRRHLDEMERLHRHQVEHWTGLMRDGTRPCPPSELPDGRLGEALRKVRDFLRPAPGRPVDPEFDRVVGALGGVDEVRRMLADEAGSGPELWACLLLGLAEQVPPSEERPLLPRDDPIEPDHLEEG